jgi:hypothetical protein
MFEARDDEGKTAADRAREAFGVEPPALDAPRLDAFSQAETVGVICDDIEGLSYFVNFGQLEAVFADPAQASGRPGKQLVLDYLKDPSVSPLPFRRLAERDPAKASEVFQTRPETAGLFLGTRRRNDPEAVQGEFLRAANVAQHHPVERSAITVANGHARAGAT